MNNFEFQGKVKEILPSEKVGDYNKRVVIVTAEEKKGEKNFTHTLAFEAWKDKASVLDNLQTDENVKVSFNIKSNEWTNSNGVKACFTSLNIWKLEKIQ